MFNRQERKKKPSATGIRIAGIESMKISLAACCAPVPGDEIIGYITKGQVLRYTVPTARIL